MHNGNQNYVLSNFLQQMAHIAYSHKIDATLRRHVFGYKEFRAGPDGPRHKPEYGTVQH